MFSRFYQTKFSHLKVANGFLKTPKAVADESVPNRERPQPLIPILGNLALWLSLFFAVFQFYISRKNQKSRFIRISII